MGHRWLLAVVYIPALGILGYYQGCIQEVPWDVVAAGSGQAVAAAVRCPGGAKVDYLIGLTLLGLQLYLLPLEQGFVLRGSKLLLGGQCQLKNQTCLTWPALRLYLIVAVFDACSPQHESTRAS